MKVQHIFIAIVGIIFLYLGLTISQAHDYITYVKQWDVILKGNDPYIGTKNAYGIIYNYFAYINLSSCFTIPRFVFIATYLVASILIWKQAILHCNKYANIILGLLLFNPIFIIFGIKYGSNDSFLAGLTLIGILLYQSNKKVLSAILLALAVGFKFTPIFIIPFFFITKLKIEFKFIIAFTLSAIVIFALGYLQWGDSIYEPFLFGAEREAKTFSIFRFISGDFYPLEFWGRHNVNHYSINFVKYSVVICFTLYIFFNLHKMAMVLLSLSFVLLFYKVAHHQFYLLLFLLLILVFINDANMFIKSKALLIATFTFWIWIFFFTILYEFTNEYENQFEIVREFVGLPTFIIHAIFNILLLKAIYKRRNIT